MDYSQLSDQVINAMVGKIVSKDGLSIIASDGNAVIHEYADCGEFKGICLGWKVFDPCNNAADAWPIIVGNDISLNSYGSAWEASFEHDAPIGAYGTDETVTSGYEHRNPLRAAMIAFLMKQEYASA
ncbi:phage protein NinX family protein [Enterobacter cloacae complex sp. 2024EL-00215]|uniref:phage protein NinX family protein n=1 Tax=unclassified Enterobacter cloacae complex TaxID=2757714 RepID=UPI003750908E